MWSTLIFSGTAAAFLAMTAYILWHSRWVRRLPPLEAFGSPSSGTRTRCSVVVAARNEEARIEQTIRHLLAQCEVEAQFIVVDDRSTDSTNEILQRLAKEDARLKVARIDALPEGWLGKCHACHIGASAATGDWILFTDADCWLAPDMITRAVRMAEREGVDHVTVASGVAGKGPGLRASHLMFLMGVANWFSGVNCDRAKSYLGFGSFNLVRTVAYRECGGYEALRLTVLDDMRLGLLLRRAGKRTRGFIGVEEAECHWGTSAWSIIKVMEKNYFAALDFRLWLVIAGTAAMLFVSFAAVLGLLSGTAAGLAAAIAPLSLIVPGVILTRRLRWAWSCALLAPFMFPLFQYALLHSTYKTLRHGGIRWRDTFYSLQTLRKGGVR